MGSKDEIGFYGYQVMGMGIVNAEEQVRITGPPEVLEKVAVALEQYQAGVDLQEKIQDLLTESLGDPDFEMEVSDTGRVSGYVLSDRFEGLSQIERQTLIWLIPLSVEERGQISYLFTQTPQEAAELDDDA